MTNRFKRTSLRVATTVLMLGISSCDEGTSQLDPTLAMLNDPPKLALIAGGKLVIVDFNWFGRGYRVRQVSGAVIPASLTKPSSARSAGSDRNGGGVDLPDPDEFDFPPPDDLPDPWDVPDFPDPTDDFPIPDLPDPFGDPFDGLPDPPLDLPPLSDLPNTNFNNGTMSFNSLGSSDFSQSTAPRPFFSSSSSPLATGVSIPIGAQPAGIVATPDGLRFLIAYAQGIAIVDRKTRTVVDRIPLPGGSRPYGIAVTPDGKTAYVTNFVLTPAELYAVDLTSKKVVATFISGAYAARIRMKPDGTQAWYTSFFDNSVTVIDVVSNTLGVRIANIVNAWDLKFNPTGTRAYVSGPIGSGDLVSVIDTSTYTVIAKIPVGINPRSLIVTPSGRHVFVANHGADTIMQIDTATNKVVRTITVGKNPTGFRFIP